MKSHASHRIFFAVLSLTAALAPSSCVGAREEVHPNETWEQFEARATRVVDGHLVYTVEWDLEVSHEELRAYYDTYIAPRSSPDGLGEAEQSLIVNRIFNVDDIWPSSNRHNLRYCVSNDFGSLKARVVSEMWAATAAWEGAANVGFVYDPSQDANCTTSNSSVIIHVQPWASSGAQAFFPSSTLANRRLVINYTDLDTNGGGVTTTAVLTHELGHVLGFRHEHTRPESGTCFENSQWRALTAYDSASVMHYPQCGGTSDTLWRMFALTDLDRAGAANLYGPGATPAGTNAIDRSNFYVRQAYRDVLNRDPDPSGFAFFMNALNACNGAPACLASTRSSIARNFLESPENRQQDPDLNPASPSYKSAFVTHCYTNFLRRQPDTSGYDFWMNYLNSTGDYDGVINGFITSSQYRKRFGTQ